MDLSKSFSLLRLMAQQEMHQRLKDEETIRKSDTFIKEVGEEVEEMEDFIEPDEQDLPLAFSTLWDEQEADEHASARWDDVVKVVENQR